MIAISLAPLQLSILHLRDLNRVSRHAAVSLFKGIKLKYFAGENCHQTPLQSSSEQVLWWTEFLLQG